MPTRFDGTADEWYAHWSQERYNWYLRYGMRPESLRMRPHEAEELAHYARGCIAGRDCTRMRASASATIVPC